MWGCLFGVRNYANFKPIVPERGIPDDSTDQIKTDFARAAEDSFSPTWVTWSEIKAIDWEEETDVEPYRVLTYVTLKNGSRQRVRSTYRRSWLAQKLSLSEEALDASWKNGQTWEIDGESYEAIKTIKRKDTLSAGWQMLFKLMETLAEQYGGDGVRLIVWFD
jgi:hypothetical protein